MAKRVVGKEFTSWIDDLPMTDEQKREIEKKFTTSTAVDKFFHLQADHTRATQQASEYKQRYEQVEPLQRWANDNQDWLRDERLPQIVQNVRAGRGQPQPQNENGRQAPDVASRFAQGRQSLQSIKAMQQRGEITFEESIDAQGRIVDAMENMMTEMEHLPQRYQQLEQQVEQLRNSIPTMMSAAEERAKQLDQKLGMGLREMGHFNHEEVLYAREHPDRVDRIFEEYKTGNYRTWGEAANALYADEDREASDQKRLEEKWAAYRAEKEAALPSNGEGAMGSLPVSPFHRPGREVPRTAETAPTEGKSRVWHARNREANVSTNLRRVLANPDAELVN